MAWTKGRWVRLVLGGGVWLVCGAAVATAEQAWVYIGTYTGGGSGSEGVYRAGFDLGSGEWGEVELAAEMENPSFLAIHPDRSTLYAVGETGEEAVVNAFALDLPTGGLLMRNGVPAMGGSPCHIDVSPSGQLLAVANYGGGSTRVIPLERGGALGAGGQLFRHEGSSVNPDRQSAPHAHSVNFSGDGKFAYVADLGTDEVTIYRVAGDGSELQPAGLRPVKLEPGSGPRHLAIHPSGETVYVINELASTISVFARDPVTGALDPVETVSTLPEDYSGGNGCAEVCVHPSGRFVYGSNRGHDSIAVFRAGDDGRSLEPVEFESESVATPRNFVVAPGGRFCLVANQATGDVRVFRIDVSTGALAPTGQVIEIDRPVCLRFVTGRGSSVSSGGVNPDGPGGHHRWPIRVGGTWSRRPV